MNIQPISSNTFGAKLVPNIYSLTKDEGMLKQFSRRTEKYPDLMMVQGKTSFVSSDLFRLYKDGHEIARASEPCQRLLLRNPETYLNRYLEIFNLLVEKAEKSGHNL